jgi:YD repeat-containing protein
MKCTVSFRRLLALGFIIVSLLFLQMTHAATGTERYSYDALGRLIKVEYPDAKTIRYVYDAAGNRKTVGPDTLSGTGTFLFISGTRTSRGVSGDIATVTIKNSGSQTISGINRSCSSGGSWIPHGNPPTSIAAGASAQFSCRALASGSYNITMTFTGTGANNSPFLTPSW